MNADDPRHGKYSGAIAHWKVGSDLCEPCRRAATRTRKANQLAAISGRPRMVEMGEAAWNIITTHPRNQLVAATGMTHERLRRYELAGPSKRVHRTTRDRILNVVAPHWTPVGLQRRLRALAALGWSLQALADRYGLGRDSLGRLRRRENPQHVKLAFGNQVAAMYGEMSMAIPPVGMSASETRAEAVRSGWATPLAWDDDTIDDPAAKPHGGRETPRRGVDPVVVERLLAGERLPATRAERDAAMRRWKAAGRSERSLCVMQGWKDSRYGRDEDAA